MKHGWQKIANAVIIATNVATTQSQKDVKENPRTLASQVTQYGQIPPTPQCLVSTALNADSENSHNISSYQQKMSLLSLNVNQNTTIKRPISAQKLQSCPSSCSKNYPLLPSFSMFPLSALSKTRSQPQLTN